MKTSAKGLIDNLQSGAQLILGQKDDKRYEEEKSYQKSAMNFKQTQNSINRKIELQGALGSKLPQIETQEE